MTRGSWTESGILGDSSRKAYPRIYNKDTDNCEAIFSPRGLMVTRRTILKGIAISALGGLRLDASPLDVSPFDRFQSKPVEPKETKIFDPADGFGPLTDVYILTDSTVVKRDNRWWMYLAGRAQNRE